MTRELRHRITSGELKAGDHLLPERQLAQHYGVSTTVVRESLARLEAEGLISREQGRGTIVQPLAAPAVEAGRRQKNVAVIFLQRMRDAATIEFFDSLQQTFQRGGYGTTIFISDDDPEKETAIVNQLVAEGVPGIVLFTSHDSGSFAHLQAAQEAGVKVVLFDHYFPGLRTNFVGINDRLAAFEATAHLIGLGCEELICVTSSRPWTTHSIRAQGFEDAARKLAPVLPRRVIEVPMFDELPRHLREEFAPILAQGRRKLGILVWNDHAALETMAVLDESGWNVPQEAAVIGFADEQEASLGNIPLTTMQIPRDQIGRLSAYLLLDQMREPGCQPEHLALSARLVIRQSCGCYSFPAKSAALSC